MRRMGTHVVGNAESGHRDHAASLQCLHDQVMPPRVCAERDGPRDALWAGDVRCDSHEPDVDESVFVAAVKFVQRPQGVSPVPLASRLVGLRIIAMSAQSSGSSPRKRVPSHVERPSVARTSRPAATCGPTPDRVSRRCFSQTDGT